MIRSEAFATEGSGKIMGFEAQRGPRETRQGQSLPCEAATRAAWRRLIGEHLPAAAPRFGWPPLTPREIEQALLDQVCAVPRASGRDACVIDIMLAIELAERALRGQVCLGKLASRSRALRGTTPSAPRGGHRAR